MPNVSQPGSAEDQLRHAVFRRNPIAVGRAFVGEDQANRFKYDILVQPCQHEVACTPQATDWRGGTKSRRILVSTGMAVKSGGKKVTGWGAGTGFAVIAVNGQALAPHFGYPF